MFFFCRLMDGCLNRGPYTRIFGGGGVENLQHLLVWKIVRHVIQTQGMSACVSWVGRGGEGREAVPVMEWYPIQG